MIHAHLGSLEERSKGEREPEWRQLVPGARGTWQDSQQPWAMRLACREGLADISGLAPKSQCVAHDTAQLGQRVFGGGCGGGAHSDAHAARRARLVQGELLG